MYLLNEKLSKRIREIAEEADIRSDHALAYEEFIALPYHGQIVLRFMLHQEEFTPDDLDRYEKLLHEIAGEEFLTDFMGCVYRKAGVDYSTLEKRLKELADQFRDEPVAESIHAAGIRADATTLLQSAGLDAGTPVWEIQMEEGAYILLLLGKESKRLLTVDEPIRLTVAEVDSCPCMGLIRAAFFCKRKGISLASVIAQRPKKVIAF